MEETEINTEGLQEQMQHHATHLPPQQSSWVSWVALSSAIFAALAAVSSLLSGHHANEAMLEQLRASDRWAQYQAKSIKASFLRYGADKTPETEEKLKKYEADQAEIQAEARRDEESSRAHLVVHQIFARAVTFAQIAIALGAVAVLSRRKRFAWVALASGILSAAFIVQGLVVR